MPPQTKTNSIPWSTFNKNNYRGQLLVWHEDNHQFSGTISEINVRPGHGIEVSLKEIEVREKIDDPWRDSSCPVRSIHFNASREPINDELGVSIGHGGNNTATIIPVRNRDDLQKVLLQQQ
ncbi:MAG: hypothetical protein HUU49_02525 [Candidatus Buchananbacteria bacterium]|nr:hypothetical protein [Candidatus Buchananbacteria bacterium]